MALIANLDMYNFQQQKRSWKLSISHKILQVIKMQRNSQIFRRPSSSKVNRVSPANHYTIVYPSSMVTTNGFIQNYQRNESIPLNQVSSIGFTHTGNQAFTQFRSPPKSVLNMIPPPITRKIYFTYINPISFEIQRQEIEAIQPSNDRQITNQWEFRYFQLYKQMNIFLSRHEKMTEQFLKIKDEMKNNNQLNFKNQLQNLTRTVTLRDQDTNQLKMRNQLLLTQTSELKIKLQYTQRQTNIYKEQSSKMSSKLQKLQTQLIQTKNLNYKIESEKNKLIADSKEVELSLKQYEKQYLLKISSLSNQKSKYQQQNIQLKIIIDKMSRQIQQLNLQLTQIKSNEKQKSPQKPNNSMTAQKFQQKLARLRVDYERKQKKLEKLVQTKSKEISDLRGFISQLQEKQRVTREMKDRYDQMYKQIKQQRDSLKNLHQVNYAEGDEQKISFYQQRIQQLNKIGKQQGEKIKHLEEEKKKLQAKIVQYQDNYVSQKQLNQLHHAISEKKNKLLEEGGAYFDEVNNKTYSYFNGKIFEEKLIYELKKDNHKLMKMLNKINLSNQIQKPQVVINQNLMFNNESGAELSMAMKAMIADTFFKLERIAAGLKQQAHINSDNFIRNSLDHNTDRKSKKSAQSSKRDETRKSMKNHYQQKQLKTKIENDLETLKAYIVDLNQVCEKLMKRLENQEKTQKIINKQQKDVLINQIKINGLIPKDQEIIEFHKNKNKQLEVRVQQLLELNTFLKAKLTQSHPEEKSREQYWKNEVRILKQNMEGVTLRYNKLLPKYEEAQEQRHNLESKVSLLTVEIERLRLQLKSIQEKHNTLKTNKNSFEQLTLVKSSIQRQLSISMHKNEQLTRKLEEVVESMYKKQNMIAQLQRKLQQLNRNKIIQQKQSRDLQNNLEASLLKISNLQKIISQEKIKFEVNMKNNTTIIFKLEGEVNELKKKQVKLQMLEKQHKIISYKLQFIRSIYLQIQCLTHQIKLFENRDQEIVKCIFVHINRALQTLSSINY